MENKVWRSHGKIRKSDDLSIKISKPIRQTYANEGFMKLKQVPFSEQNKSVIEEEKSPMILTIDQKDEKSRTYQIQDRSRQRQNQYDEIYSPMRPSKFKEYTQSNQSHLTYQPIFIREKSKNHKINQQIKMFKILSKQTKTEIQGFQTNFNSLKTKLQSQLKYHLVQLVGSLRYSKTNQPNQIEKLNQIIEQQSRQIKKLKTEKQSQKEPESKNQYPQQDYFEQQFELKYKRLERKNRSLTCQIDQQNMKINRLSKIVKEREEQIRRVCLQIEQNQYEIKRYKNKNFENEQKIEHLTSKYQRQIKVFQQNQERTEQRNQQLISDNRKFRTQMNEINTKINSEDRLITKLTKQNQELSHKHQQSKEFYNKLQQKSKTKLNSIQSYLKQLEIQLEVYYLGKDQEAREKEQELCRLNIELQHKLTEINDKQFQVRQMKQVYQNSIKKLDQREAGLKEFYNDAIQLKEKEKQKWYDRYNSFFDGNKSPSKANYFSPQLKRQLPKERKNKESVFLKSKRSTEISDRFMIPTKQKPQDNFLIRRQAISPKMTDRYTNIRQKINFFKSQISKDINMTQRR